MSNTLTRIKEYIDFKGLSVRNFEETVGFSNGSFASQLKNHRTIGVDRVENILHKYSDINAEWLLTGQGSMLKGDTSEIGCSSDRIKDTISQKAIPLIPIEAFVGYPTEQFNDMPIEEYYQINEFSNADFLIRVKGDSMTPKYNGGDLVACKKIQEITFFQWHRIYVVYTKSQGIVIKRVEPAPTEDCIELVSENPAYKPFLLKKEEIDDIAIVLGAVTLE